MDARAHSHQRSQMTRFVSRGIRDRFIRSRDVVNPGDPGFSERVAARALTHAGLARITIHMRDARPGHRRVQRGLFASNNTTLPPGGRSRCSL